ncbi:MAG: type II toxin-antitoxin system Phd/YefM family antitoxin [Gammaproteobacteria bacterium]|nr:type II toxin-antitoxin system Phd/YefM family antitoxin [Gammaproteobacteria bacterium]
MSVITLSSRELNQDIGRAKKAAKETPVVITNRGKPEFVLLSFESYQSMFKQRRNIADTLGMPSGVEDINFEPPRISLFSRSVDFS